MAIFMPVIKSAYLKLLLLPGNTSKLLVHQSRGVVISVSHTRSLIKSCRAWVCIREGQWVTLAGASYKAI